MSTHSAVLLISCPDRPGIVAAVASWVTHVGGNIVHAEQHTDTQDTMFFQRVQFTHDGSHSIEVLTQQFDVIAQNFAMEYVLRELPWRPRTAILSSKAVHCLADLLTRSKYGDLGLDIQAVISNHEDHRDLVKGFDYRFEYVPVARNSHGDIDAIAREQQEHRVAAVLEELNVDFVILARYMLILSPWFTDKWSGRMINIHHSFLPAFIGANPYRQAHDRGVKIIGATAHYVTRELDEGPIIEQDVAHVSHRDDVAELTSRGRDLETVVLARAVRAHVEHRVLVWNNRTVVFG
jgi:formyltetrahydrofolate deformylase